MEDDVEVGFGGDDWLNAAPGLLISGVDVVLCDRREPVGIA